MSTAPGPPGSAAPPGRWTFLVALAVVLLLAATALAVTVAIFR